MSTREEVAEATNKMLDAFRTLADDVPDGDLVFVDHHLRAIAEHLGIAWDWPEIEPMTAAEFRSRNCAAKEALAAGRGPRVIDFGGQGDR